MAPQFLSVEVPRDVVASLAQCRQGLIWVGTGNGLARWDGYHLQAIEREADEPLRRNLGWVQAMAAGADGRVWIGSESDGLLVHEPRGQRIRQLGGIGPPAAIRALASDDAQVWIGTLGQGLQRYDIASGRFSRIELPAARVLSLYLDAEATLWIGHWKGLARLRAGASEAEPVALPGAPSPVQALSGDAQGRLWLGLQDGRLGLIEAGRLQWRSGPGGGVQALALDGEGRLWVGRRTGVEIRDGDGQLLEALQHQAHRPGGLAGDEVRALLRDRDGAMWVAGLGIGLQRQLRSGPLRLLGADPDPASPLHRPDIRALLLRRNGELLLATHAGPIARLDAALRPLGSLAHDGAPVEALAESADGRLWLLGGNGLHCQRADRPCGRWQLGGGRGHLMRVRPDGELLIGLQEGGYRLAVDGRLEPLRGVDGQPLQGAVNGFADDGEGGLLLASVHGLLQRRAGEAVWRLIPQHPTEGLGSSILIGLLRARDGTLWLDTAVAGLHRLLGIDADGRARFERISQRHGAVGMPFGANLHEDGQGRIWSQTHVYDPATDRLQAFSLADGLRLGTPWFFATERLPDGRLLFGGSRGLQISQPSAYRPLREAPPLVLTGLRVEGRARPLGEALLSLAPGTRGFSVEFAALDFDDPQRLQYRYRLQGLETDWIQVDASRRSASYGELPPGDYRLQLQARRPLGDWGEPGLSQAIEVQAAWWQQSWARLLGLLALLLAVWALLQGRTWQLRQREARLQALVDERTAALREASLTDPLTGLKNRRYLMQRIQSDLKLAQRRAAQQALDADLLIFLIDLDHFKQLNDSLGHVAGDLALQQAAERLRQVFRDTDMLVRWGGEEFLAVAQASRRDHAGELAERLRRALADAPMLLGDALQIRTVTASIGFAVFPPRQGSEAWDWNAVLQLADAALYAAKAAGRNTWVGVLIEQELRPAQLLSGAALLDSPGLRLVRP